MRSECRPMPSCAGDLYLDLTGCGTMVSRGKFAIKNAVCRSCALQKLFRSEFVCAEQSSGCCRLSGGQGGYAKIVRLACNYLRPSFVFVLAFIHQQGRHLPWTLP